MKIEIYLDKEGKGEDKEKDMESALMSAEEHKKAMLMQRRVAKMLAKMAGRSTPNELDMETAMDFVEDNAEYEKAK